MNKKIIVLMCLILTIAGTAYACYKKKQCCKRDYKGLTCITVCDYQFCPYDYPIEME